MANKTTEVSVIILAGGTAPRMRPLSLNKPKTMISFMGEPLLRYLINSLKSSKFLEILVYTSYGQREAREYFSAGNHFGVSMKYYEGKEWYGTAGTTREIISKMGEQISDTFMVIYGDSLLRVNYQKMLEFHKRKKSWATILYHSPNFESFLYDKAIPGEKRTNYGVMDVDFNGRITKVIEKPTITEISNKFRNPVANAAVYVLEKKVLDFVPLGCFFDFPRNLFPLLIDNGIPCFGFDIGRGYRIDIGTIPYYYNTQLAILEGRLAFDFCFPVIKEGIWIGRGSVISSIDSLKKPVLICEKSRLESNVYIERSVVGNNVYVGESSRIINSIILDNVHIGNMVEIFNSIIGENCSINHGISLPPRTVLGSYCNLGGLDWLGKEELANFVKSL